MDDYIITLLVLPLFSRALLKLPGTDNGYLCTGEKAVVFDFAKSRSDKAAVAEPFTPAAYANPRFARDAASLFASPPQQDFAALTAAQLDLLH